MAEHDHARGPISFGGVKAETSSVRGRTVHRQGRVALALGALGVVYGDIGTNPLFAMREAFLAHHLAVTDANILGLLSLIFWSLVLVISVKYVGFVMRASNEGEGGILALVALIRGVTMPPRRRWILVLLGLFGAALLYGDGIITPSISVLAAVEGTQVATPGLHAIVVPAAITILVILFLLQRRGTAAIGRLFGPVMVVWFTVIGALGAAQILKHPAVVRAVSPSHAVSFFVHDGTTAFLVLGAVILVVVGGEALYADLGHFGRAPIAMGWYGVVLPSLVLVYFGQGALLLREPSAIENPFYRLSPGWALYPLVVLATIATVIASQALISGAYSLTLQAVQLGYAPRVYIKHTSETHFGQIYIPSVNWLLMLACVGLVLGFRRSENLAAAYGLAVSGTMLITTVLFFVVVRERFRWPARLAVPLCSLFLVVDLSFFGATLFKIPRGGWLPLVVGAVVFTVLTTWHTGRRLVRERLHGGLPLTGFVESLSQHPPVRAPGTGAYLFSQPGVTPPALVASLRHHDSLHEQVLVISVVTEDRPRVHQVKRCEITRLGLGFHEVVLRFGFMEDPDVPKALAARAARELGLDLGSVTYFLGRESIQVTDRPGMAIWREHLFAVMSRNAVSAARYFHLPPEQTFELGVVVAL
jgi:KUP system potassium uptake protein